MEPNDEPSQTAGSASSTGQKASSVMRRVWVIVVPIALVALVAALFLFMTTDDPGESRAPAADDSSLGAVQTFEVSADHVIEPVEYEQTPPVGGPHNPLWLNCGIYPTEVPNENVVHSMEHGAVWISYAPDLPDESVALLEERTPDTYAVLSPYTGLPSPIVVSAWGAQLQIDEPDDPRIEAFIRAYRSAGEAPEIGAPCTGASDGTVPLDAVS